jgi:hypothetical protein
MPPSPPPAFTAGHHDLETMKEQLQAAEERARSAERQVDSNWETVRMMHMLLLFGLPAVFVAGFLFARYKTYEHLNCTLRSLLERGIAVPPELMTPTVRKDLGWSDLRKGVMWIWFGIALMIFLANSFHGGAASVGLVPMFIGVAYLLLWFMDRRKQASK